jgi:hypothetical protein
MLCEELTLRARLDLNHGRLAHAALELDSALAAALWELGQDSRPDLAPRVDELRTLRPGVTRVARTMLPGGDAAGYGDSSGVDRSAGGDPQNAADSARADDPPTESDAPDEDVVATRSSAWKPRYGLARPRGSPGVRGDSLPVLPVS